MIGAPKNQYTIGWRRTIIKCIISTMSRLGLFIISFVWFSYIDEDSVDYTEWLGKDYKPPKERAPIIIANHQSWLVTVVCKYRIV
jgi:hypothetical protein